MAHTVDRDLLGFSSEEDDGNSSIASFGSLDVDLPDNASAAAGKARQRSVSKNKQVTQPATATPQQQRGTSVPITKQAAPAPAAAAVVKPTAAAAPAPAPAAAKKKPQPEPESDDDASVGSLDLSSDSSLGSDLDEEPLPKKKTPVKVAVPAPVKAAAAPAPAPAAAVSVKPASSHYLAPGSSFDRASVSSAQPAQTRPDHSQTTSSRMPPSRSAIDDDLEDGLDLGDDMDFDLGSLDHSVAASQAASRRNSIKATPLKAAPAAPTAEKQAQQQLAAEASAAIAARASTSKRGGYVPPTTAAAAAAATTTAPVAQTVAASAAPAVAAAPAAAPALAAVATTSDTPPRQESPPAPEAQEYQPTLSSSFHDEPQQQQHVRSTPPLINTQDTINAARARQAKKDEFAAKFTAENARELQQQQVGGGGVPRTRVKKERPAFNAAIGNKTPVSRKLQADAREMALYNQTPSVRKPSGAAAVPVRRTPNPNLRRTPSARARAHMRDEYDHTDDAGADFSDEEAAMARLEGGAGPSAQPTPATKARPAPSSSRPGAGAGADEADGPIEFDEDSPWLDSISQSLAPGTTASGGAAQQQQQRLARGARGGSGGGVGGGGPHHQQRASLIFSQHEPIGQMDDVEQLSQSMKQLFELQRTGSLPPAGASKTPKGGAAAGQKRFAGVPGSGPVSPKAVQQQQQQQQVVSPRMRVEVVPPPQSQPQQPPQQQQQQSTPAPTSIPVAAAEVLSPEVSAARSAAERAQQALAAALASIHKIAPNSKPLVEQLQQQQQQQQQLQQQQKKLATGSEEEEEESKQSASGAPLHAAIPVEDDGEEHAEQGHDDEVEFVGGSVSVSVVGGGSAALVARGGADDGGSEADFQRALLEQEARDSADARYSESNYAPSTIHGGGGNGGDDGHAMAMAMSSAPAVQMTPEQYYAMQLSRQAHSAAHQAGAADAKDPFGYYLGSPKPSAAYLQSLPVDEARRGGWNEVGSSPRAWAGNHHTNNPNVKRGGLPGEVGQYRHQVKPGAYSVEAKRARAKKISARAALLRQSRDSLGFGGPEDDFFSSEGEGGGGDGAGGDDADYPAGPEDDPSYALGVHAHTQRMAAARAAQPPGLAAQTKDLHTAGKLHRHQLKQELMHTLHAGLFGPSQHAPPSAAGYPFPSNMGVSGGSSGGGGEEHFAFRNPETGGRMFVAEGLERPSAATDGGDFDMQHQHQQPSLSSDQQGLGQGAPASEESGAPALPAYYFSPGGTQQAPLFHSPSPFAHPSFGSGGVGAPVDTSVLPPSLLAHATQHFVGRELHRVDPRAPKFAPASSRSQAKQRQDKLLARLFDPEAGRAEAEEKRRAFEAAEKKRAEEKRLRARQVRQQMKANVDAYHPANERMSPRKPPAGAPTTTGGFQIGVVPPSEETTTRAPAQFDDREYLGGGGTTARSIGEEKTSDAGQPPKKAKSKKKKKAAPPVDPTAPVISRTDMLYFKHKLTEQKKVALRAELAEAELAACTFQPNMDQVVVRGQVKTRSKKKKNSSKSTENDDGDDAGDGGHGTRARLENLYKSYESTQQKLADQRVAAAAAALAREKDHPFAPVIHPHRPVSSTVALANAAYVKGFEEKVGLLRRSAEQAPQRAGSVEKWNLRGNGSASGGMMFGTEHTPYRDLYTQGLGSNTLSATSFHATPVFPVAGAHTQRFTSATGHSVILGATAGPNALSQPATLESEPVPQIIMRGAPGSAAPFQMISGMNPMSPRANQFSPGSNRASIVQDGEELDQTLRRLDGRAPRQHDDNIPFESVSNAEAAGSASSAAALAFAAASNPRGLGLGIVLPNNTPGSVIPRELTLHDAVSSYSYQYAKQQIVEGHLTGGGPHATTGANAAAAQATHFPGSNLLSKPTRGVATTPLKKKAKSTTAKKAEAEDEEETVVPDYLKKSRALLDAVTTLSTPLKPSSSSSTSSTFDVAPIKTKAASPARTPVRSQSPARSSVAAAAAPSSAADAAAPSSSGDLFQTAQYTPSPPAVAPASTESVESEVEFVQAEPEDRREEEATDSQQQEEAASAAVEPQAVEAETTSVVMSDYSESAPAAGPPSALTTEDPADAAPVASAEAAAEQPSTDESAVASVDVDDGAPSLSRRGSGTSLASSSSVLLFVDIQLGDRTERITVRHGDATVELAAAFVQQHALDAAYAPVIQGMLDQQIQALPAQATE